MKTNSILITIIFIITPLEIIVEKLNYGIKEKQKKKNTSEVPFTELQRRWNFINLTIRQKEKHVVQPEKLAE